MWTKRNLTWIVAGLAVALVVVLPACKEETKPEPAADTGGALGDLAKGAEGAAKEAGEAAGEAIDKAKEAITAKLAKADAYDGAEDKTVSKCLVCGLGMDGDAANKAEFEGYTFHFCKDGCLSKFKEDMGKAVAGLTVPGA